MRRRCGVDGWMDKVVGGQGGEVVGEAQGRDRDEFARAPCGTMDHNLSLGPTPLYPGRLS